MSKVTASPNRVMHTKGKQLQTNLHLRIRNTAVEAPDYQTLPVIGNLPGRLFWDRANQSPGSKAQPRGLRGKGGAKAVTNQ